MAEGAALAHSPGSERLRRATPADSLPSRDSGGDSASDGTPLARLPIGPCDEARFLPDGGLLSRQKSRQKESGTDYARVNTKGHFSVPDTLSRDAPDSSPAQTLRRKSAKVTAAPPELAEEFPPSVARALLTWVGDRIDAQARRNLHRKVAHGSAAIETCHPDKAPAQSTTSCARLGQSGSLQATEPQGGPDRTKPPHPPEFSSAEDTARAPLHPLIDSSDRHLK
jgi:hypothetical protein